MPIAKRQDMFPMERCSCCGKDAVLRLSHNNTYRWACHKGGTSWVTEGSELETYNNLVREYVDYSGDSQG